MYKLKFIVITEELCSIFRPSFNPAEKKIISEHYFSDGIDLRDPFGPRDSNDSEEKVKVYYEKMSNFVVKNI